MAFDRPGPVARIAGDRAVVAEEVVFVRPELDRVALTAVAGTGGWRNGANIRRQAAWHGHDGAVHLYRTADELDGLARQADEALAGSVIRRPRILRAHRDDIPSPGCDELVHEKTIGRLDRRRHRRRRHGECLDNVPPQRPP